MVRRKRKTGVIVFNARIHSRWTHVTVAWFSCFFAGLTRRRGVKIVSRRRPGHVRGWSRIPARLARTMYPGGPQPYRSGGARGAGGLRLHPGSQRDRVLCCCQSGAWLSRLEGEVGSYAAPRSAGYFHPRLYQSTGFFLLVLPVFRRESKRGVPTST